MRYLLIIIFITLLLTGCDLNVKSKPINSIEFHPVIDHLLPSDGSGYAFGSDIEFSCKIYTLNSDITDWYIYWVSDVDGFLYTHHLEEDGISTFSSSDLSNNDHNISISVANPETGEHVEKTFTIYNNLPEYIDYDDYSFLGKSGNSFYFVSHLTTSWSGADSLCIANQGNLVSITSVEENNYIESKLFSFFETQQSRWDDELWIGLYYDLSSDSLRWVTNEEYLFENFNYEFEPYDDIPFVYIDCSNGNWSAAGYYSKRFILELEE